MIYAIALGWPTETIAIQALGTSSANKPGKVAKVELLGTGAKLKWSQAPDGLRIEVLKQYKPTVDYAAAFKIMLA